MNKKGFTVLPILFVVTVTLLILGVISYPRVKSKLINKTIPVISQLTSRQSEIPFTPVCGVKPPESNDGWLLFAEENYKNFPIYDLGGKKISFINADGNGAIKLSPNREMVVYTSDYNIWLYDIDKGCKTKITNMGKPATIDYEAIVIEPIIWSFDSNKIIYTLTSYKSYQNEFDDQRIRDPSAKYGIYLFDLDKKAISYIGYPELLRVQGGHLMGDFMWPQDFPNPIFQYYGGENTTKTANFEDGQIYELNINNLLFTPARSLAFIGRLRYLKQAAFSRDGNVAWISTSTEGDNTNYQIRMSNLDGSELLTIAPKWKYEYYPPQFSSDGKLISYIKVVEPKEPSVHSALNIYNTETGETISLFEEDDILYHQWLNNQVVIFESGKNIYSINVNSKERDIFASNLQLLK